MSNIISLHCPSISTRGEGVNFRERSGKTGGNPGCRTGGNAGEDSCCWRKVGSFIRAKDLTYSLIFLFPDMLGCAVSTFTLREIFSNSRSAGWEIKRWEGPHNYLFFSRQEGKNVEGRKGEVQATSTLRAWDPPPALLVVRAVVTMGNTSGWLLWPPKAALNLYRKEKLEIALFVHHDLTHLLLTFTNEK